MKEVITKKQLEDDKCHYCYYEKCDHGYCKNELNCKRASGSSDGFLFNSVLYDIAEDETEKKNDPTNPQHYKETSIECIEVMLIVFGKKAVVNFCMCNAFKYLWRYSSKNGLEDLQKAQWYINRAMSLDEFNERLEALQDVLTKHMEEYV